MTDPIVSASGKSDLLVWLVLAIFWVMAQLASVGKGKKSAPRAPTPPPGQPQLDQELKDLFDAMRGQTAQPPTTRETVKPYVQADMRKPFPPRAAPEHRSPPPTSFRQFQTQKAVRVEAPRPPVRPAAPPALAPAPVPPPPAVQPYTPGGYESVMAFARSGIQAQQGSLFSLKGMRQPAFKIAPTARHGKPAPDVLQMFKGHGALKNSIVSRVVLGPPKGL